MEQFIKKYSLRTSDFDKNSKIFPSSILDLFQDAAGEHAAILGCSGEEMLKKGLLWVLVRVRFEILKQPEKNSEVTVLTWPKPQKGIRFERDYKVLDAKGEVLINGSSNWVFIDAKSRKIQKTYNVYPENLNYVEQDACRLAAAKIALPDNFDSTYKTVAEFIHLDSNGHVNNIKYADFITCALKQNDIAIECLQIDYHKELLFGDTVSVYTKSENSDAVFKGVNENGEAIFTAKAQLNKR